MRWKDLGRRFVVSILGIAVVGFLLAFAYHQFFQYLLVAFIALLSGMGVWEFSKIAKEKGITIRNSLVIAAAVLIVFSFYLSAQLSENAGFPFIVLFLATIAIFASHFHHSNNALVDIATSVFSLIYIAIPLGLFIPILYVLETGEGGRLWIIYLLVVTKITDIGAYFGGRLWGEKKLAPIISPQKTLFGSLLGLVCSVVASGLFAYLTNYFCPSCWVFSVKEGLGLGLVLGIIGQIGDLGESLFKRDANVKDSNTIPGLGGVLDTVDSLLFTTPIIYLFLNW